MGTTLNHIGLAYRQLGVADSALHYLRKALATYRAAAHTSNQAVALFNIGSVFHDHQWPDSARAYFRRALELAKRTEDRTLVEIIQRRLNRP